MSREKSFTQCRLIYGHNVMVSWIPSSIAKVGTRVRLKSSNKEEWSDPWMVMEVWRTLPYTKLLAHERDYMHQREASDI